MRENEKIMRKIKWGSDNMTRGVYPPKAERIEESGLGGRSTSPAVSRNVCKTVIPAIAALNHNFKVHNPQ